MTRIYLAHGASGNADSMLPHVRGLRGLGLEAETVQLPRGKAERAMPAFLAAASPGADILIGGHSFGGRVASMLAADHAYAGLVLLSYPLHAPGSPDRWEERTSHWSRITCPVLLISGDRDQFARIELLRQAVGQLPQHDLVVYPGLRHGIGPRLREALPLIADFARRVTESVHSGT